MCYQDHRETCRIQVYSIKQDYHASPTCTQGHHASQGTIEGVQETPGLGKHELVDEEDGQAAGGGAQDGVHDGEGHHGSVISPGDASLHRR